MEDCHTLEFRGFLSTGATETLFKDTSISINEVMNSILRYKAERSRVNDADFHGTHLYCQMDDIQQKARPLADIDKKDTNAFWDRRELAVGYFKDALFAKEVDVKAALNR